MYTKIVLKLSFDFKRNKKLITPCCNKKNTDGKFVNYKNLPEKYGFCHSCGKTILPPPLYKDDFGNRYFWNSNENKFENTVLQTYDKYVLQMYNNSVTHCNTLNIKKKSLKFIDFDMVIRYYNQKNENNLLKYLRHTYGNTKVDLVKKMYYIGTSKDMGTVFWNINSNCKAQKAKVSYYKLNGKRTNKFKVPYKNDDGYYSCFFGEHLINLKENISKTIVLVESEKTAIVCSMLYDQYVWLSYGGINGLTNEKVQVLIGRRVLIAPDISENAVNIIKKKTRFLNKIGVEVKIWDMTDGKTDDQLKNEGIYNCDLEDFLRESQ